MGKRVVITVYVDDEAFEVLKKISDNGDVCHLIGHVLRDGGIEVGAWFLPPFDKVECVVMDDG